MALLAPLLLGLSALPAAASAEAGETLDAYFTRLADHGFSGAVLVARGDQLLLRKGYGFADRRSLVPNGPGTAFNIASLDKQFLAAGILRLEEMGKLRTGDPIVRFFDDVPAGKRGITLHQVLSHTAGFPDEYWDEHETMTRSEFIRWVLAERPLLAPPGTRFAYSSFDYWLLEEVIERVSGVPFERFLRRELFDPAGLPSTGFALPDWAPGQVARTTFWAVPDSLLRGEARFVDPLSRPPAWRVLLSTADDLRRWQLALRDGLVLTPESRRKLFAPVREGYAYGWNVVPTARGTRLIHHGGGGSFVGGVATFRWFADEDAFVVLLNNSLMGGFSLDYVMADVEAILFGGGGSMPPPSAPLDRTAAAALAGSYRLPGGGAIEISLAPGGPLVAVAFDPRAVTALRFGGTAGSSLPPDRPASEIVEAWARGDLRPLLRSAAGSPAALRTLRKRAREAMARAVARHGPFRAVSTLHRRTFVYEGEPEVHAYLLLRFERGEEILRVLHLPSGKLEIDLQPTPPGIEAVLAPSPGGGYTTWDPRLGAAVRLHFEPNLLRLTGSGGAVSAARVASEAP